MTAQCRSCNQPIIWTTNITTDARMPVDPEPVVGGNVVLTAGNDGPEAEVLGKDEVARRKALGLRLHVSHFSTCKDAVSWRRR